MSTLAITQRPHELGAESASDESAFSELAERYRRGLQAHCYRMLGSYEESEDLTQETFLRAWRSRESFQGRSSFGTWLYRIATNRCLSSLERSGRWVPADGPDLERILSQRQSLLATSDDGLDAHVVSKETIELALLVAVRELPPRQRAVLFLRDVLGWSAKETAELLETSVAAVNSALMRARATLRKQLNSRGVAST
jgi:RNA polymerase sigma-70 factor (ECF subfamily)